MPKRRSIKKKRVVKELYESTPIDKFFSDLDKTTNKITIAEQENLKKSIETTLQDIITNLCKIRSSSCNQLFISDLDKNTKELPGKLFSTLEYWLLRIYYLYKTVNSFSGKGMGKNYLMDVNLNLEMIFTDTKQSIEKSADRQATIDLYKQNLFYLRKGLIDSFTDGKYLSSLLQEINWSNFETPISIILDINKKITDKIIEFDQGMFENVKRGMREPFNVVNNTKIDQVDNSTDLTNSTNSDRVLLDKPEIKTARLLEGISTSPQFWTGLGMGSALVSIITTVGIGFYCCFFTKHKGATADRDAEANKESKPLVNYQKNN